MRKLLLAAVVGVLLLMAPLGPSSAVIVQVGIDNFFFSPDTVTISVGDTVRWTNLTASTPHTSTSDSGVWNSGTLNPGQSYDHQFAATGGFPYHCSIHPSMHGIVLVQQTGIGGHPGTDSGRPQLKVEVLPNPSRGRAEISYVLPAESAPALGVYDVLGREILTWNPGRQYAGTHSLDWNERDLPSGVYLVRLRVGASPAVVQRHVIAQ